MDKAIVAILAVIVGAVAGIFGNWLTKPARLTNKVAVVILCVLVTAAAALAGYDKTRVDPPPHQDTSAAGGATPTPTPPVSPPKSTTTPPTTPPETPPGSSANPPDGPVPETATTAVKRTQYLQDTPISGSPNVLNASSGLTIQGDPYAHGIGIECAPGADGGVTYVVGSFTHIHATMGLADGAPDSSVIRNDTSCQIEFSSNGAVLKTLTESPTQAPS
ncbi:MAG: hypothetical protein QOI78_7061, partial [Actinomycetota bacterium]|nr:hypothetical protein [Actinomycetota bacterium]